MSAEKTSLGNESQPSCLGAVRRSFWCRIGLHDWYHGNYIFPVWGRYERHCLNCHKKQYSVYKDKKHHWIDF